jgi:hypothetical protein
MRAFFSFRLILNRLTIGLRIHPSVRESGLVVGGVGGPLAADPAGGPLLECRLDGRPTLDSRQRGWQVECHAIAREDARQATGSENNRSLAVTYQTLVTSNRSRAYGRSVTGTVASRAARSYFPRALVE